VYLGVCRGRYTGSLFAGLFSKNLAESADSSGPVPRLSQYDTDHEEDNA